MQGVAVRSRCCFVALLAAFVCTGCASETWDWDWDWHRDFGFDLALFFDTGMAWSDKNAVIKIDDLKSSAGVGFLFGGDDGFRLDAIWPFEDPENDVVFQARLQRMF